MYQMFDLIQTWGKGQSFKGRMASIKLVSLNISDCLRSATGKRQDILRYFEKYHVQ